MLSSLFSLLILKSILLWLVNFWGVGTNEISALVKILDRLHNVSTLDKSSLEHRKKQLLETRQVYLPLTKVYRRQYWEYGNFYFQARLIMTSILNVIEQLNIQEETVIELKEKLKHFK